MDGENVVAAMFEVTRALACMNKNHSPTKADVLLRQQAHLMKLMDEFRYTPALDTASLFAAARAVTAVQPKKVLFLDGPSPQVVVAAVVMRLFGIGRCGILCSEQTIRELISGSAYRDLKPVEMLFKHRLIKRYYGTLAEMLGLEIEWPTILTQAGFVRLLKKLEIELVSNGEGEHWAETYQLNEWLTHRLENTSITTRLLEEMKVSSIPILASRLTQIRLWRGIARVALNVDAYDLCIGGREYTTGEVATATLVCLKQPDEGLSSQLVMNRRLLGPGGQGTVLICDPAYDPYVTASKRLSSAAYCVDQLDWLTDLRVAYGLPACTYYAAPISFATNGSADPKHVGDQINVSIEMSQRIRARHVICKPYTVQIDAGLEPVFDTIVDAAKLPIHEEGAYGVLVAKCLNVGNPVIKALNLHRLLFDQSGPGSHFTIPDPETPGGRMCPAWDLSRKHSCLAIAQAAANMQVFAIDDKKTRDRVLQHVIKQAN